MRTPRSESTWGVADLRNICFEVHKPGLVQRDLVFGGRLGVGVGKRGGVMGTGRGGGAGEGEGVRSGTMVIKLISVRSVWNTDAGWELNQKGNKRVNPVHLHDAILVTAVIGSGVVVGWSGWVEGG